MKDRITKDDMKRLAELAGGMQEPDPSFVKPIVTVKITGTTAGSYSLGGGKYTGRMVQNAIEPAVSETAWLTDNLTTDDLAFDTVDDCYVLYYAEAGTGDHSLAVDTVVNGHVIGYAPDGRYIVAVSEGGGGVTRVRVSGDLAGGGKYVGHVVARPTAAIAITGNLADTDLGADGAAEIVIVNAEEVGQSTHDLTATTVRQKTFLAVHIGASNEETPRPVYQINGFDVEDC